MMIRETRRGLGLIVLNLFVISMLQAQIDFGTQQNYRYLKGNQAQTLNGNWKDTDFDDSGWLTGSAPFRYGDGTGGTELTDMKGNYSTLFLRSDFTVANLDMLGTVKIRADWDDGFILWINGAEILSNQAPSEVSYNALASGLHEYGDSEYFSYAPSELPLIEGENTIAVFACNITLSNSSDFYFDMSMNASVELPETEDTVGIAFSHESGFCTESFDLSMVSQIEGATLVYTLDGSNPQTSTTRIEADSTVSITIDPTSTLYRANTPAVTVRASVVKDGYGPSKPETRTFIYLEAVKTQSNPGGGWPAENLSDDATQYIDYGMDSDVVNSSQYKNLIDKALTDIPTISIVTDNANLFDQSTGIYTNASQQGYEWERECSVELINFDDTVGFNVNAGLRIRGGWSRHNNFPKHSFRLFFRAEYGNSKLEYPLFGDEGVAEYDKVDLRTAQNYSWANNSNSKHNTFLREVFTRDSQCAAGQPYTRSRYYHLYLNGMYWGMYQTQERSEARFAESYFGDNSDDYDVIKISGEDYSKEIVATDGTTQKWEEIYALTQYGFSSNVQYFRLEGKNAIGERVAGAEVYVDIDNLIDYMINIFYTGNYDAPVSAWGGNKKPNNMYAITNREDKSFGFKFFVHDGEHTLMNEASAGPGIGLYENRVDIGDRTGDDKMTVTDFSYFHSQWLHYKLSQNMEYRLRFADRAWKHFNGQGIFTQEEAEARFNKRVGQIEYAIIAESARWGDTRSATPYTKDNAWIPQINAVLNNYLPYRTNIVIDQLLDKGLYSYVDAPLIINGGDEVYTSTIDLTTSTDISLENPSGAGDIYYTITGEDPRKVGGDVSDGAVKIGSGEKLDLASSTVLKARVLNGSTWSAISELTVLADQTDYSNLKITELHYHPTDSIIGNDTTSGKKYEFIEFKNTGTDKGINLTGLVLEVAIDYEFPENYVLAPQQYFVVAAKPAKFFDRYGLIASGNFQKNLSNSGERIVVRDGNGEAIIGFAYLDESPWPEAPDGGGYSLESSVENPTGNPQDYAYWKCSDVLHGTPFDYIDTSAENNVSAESYVNDLDNLKVYPNITRDCLNIQSGGKTMGYNVSVYDVSGTLLYNQEFIGSTKLSFNELHVQEGIYFVKVFTSQSSITQKVVYIP